MNLINRVIFQNFLLIDSNLRYKISLDISLLKWMYEVLRDCSEDLFELNAVLKESSEFEIYNSERSLNVHYALAL